LNKVFPNADAAISDLPDGSTIMAGGFVLCGIPENLIAAVNRKGVRDLTVISNNAGVDDFGVGLWLAYRQITKIIATDVGENKLFEELVLKAFQTTSEQVRVPAIFGLPAGGISCPSLGWLCRQTVEVPLACKLPRYAVLGSRRGGGHGMAQTRNGPSSNS
jgi:3-oxoacid CoA-transferase subunit A